MNTDQGDHLPINEQSNRYNPRQLFLWGLDTEIFVRDMPSVVKSLLSMTHLPPGSENSQAVNIMFKMRDDLDKLVSDSSNLILGPIYREWANSQGLTEETEVYGMKMNLPINPENLSPEKHREWEVYKTIGTASRVIALEIVSSIIGRIPKTHNKYVFDPSLEQLKQDLDKSRYQIVTSVFPDLTDEEAHTIFGQLTSAQDVIEKAKAF